MSDFDPLAPETFESPHDEFHRLRGTCPIAHSDAWDGFWAATRYEDVSEMANNSRQFITSVQNVVPKVAFTGRRPPLHLDPPEHTPYRKALAPLLTPSKIARLEPVIQEICEDLLRPMLANGGGDICAEYSAPMPVKAFAHWMNLPRKEIEELAQVGRKYNFAVQENDVEATKQASTYLYDMARRLVAERRNNPLDPDIDAASALLAGEYQGQPLPEELVVGTIRQVLVVGIIAPTVFFGSVSVHLSRDQALQQRLRQDPGLVPDAIEEFLRLYTPYRGFARTSVSDIELRGRLIRKDEPIALVYAAANRDPEVFEAPDEFRMGRPNIKSSIAFGRGPHACVGAALGRLEMIVALRCLLQATKQFEVCGPIGLTRMPEIGALRVPLRFA